MELKTGAQVNAAELGRLGVTSRPDSRGSSLSSQRVDPWQLVQRYGMWVHRCVTLNASTAASVPFKLMQRTSSEMIEKHGRLLHRKRIDAKTKHSIRNGWEGFAPGGRAKAIIHQAPMDDLVEITNHAALDVLQDINEWSEGYAWRESVYADLQIYGKAYTHVVAEGSSGLPLELWRMIPHMTRPIPDPETFVSGFELSRTGTDVTTFDPEEVLWFKLFDPEDPWGGRGPLEAWLLTIDSSFQIQQFQSWLMKRGGAPDYIVQSEKPLQESQKQAFRLGWRRMFGRLFRRDESVGFLSGGTLERLGQTNRELEFNDSEDKKRDQIGQAFGIPKALLTSDDINRSNAREAQEQHMRNLWSMVQRVEDVLNERLISRYNGNLFIVHESPIPRDETIRIQERASKLASGWTVNEVRVEDGDEPIEDEMADQPLLAGTLKTLEQVVEPPPPPPNPLAPVQGAEPMEDGNATDGDSTSADDEEEDPDKRLVEMLVKAIEQLRQPAVTLNVADLVKQPEVVTMNGNSHHALPAAKANLGEVAEDDFDDTYNNPKMQAAVEKEQRRQAAELVPRMDEVWAGKRVSKVSHHMTTKDAIDTLIDLLFANDFIDGWIRALTNIVAPLFGDVLVEAGDEAIIAVNRDTGTVAATGISFNLENTRAQDYVNQASKRIGRTATDTWRDQLKEVVTKGLDEGKSNAEIAWDIQEITDEFTPAKAEMIARTETAYASIAATEMGWMQSGVVTGKVFVCAPECCEWCQAVDAHLNKGGVEKSVPLGQAFFDKGATVTGTVQQEDGSFVEKTFPAFDYTPLEDGPIQVPPVHPHCRCSLKPVLAKVVPA